MNSVCIRRPAEFSGYSRLRSSASRSDGGSFSRISSWSSSSRPSSNSTASSDSSSRTPSATVSGSSSSRISSRTESSTSFSAEKSKSVPVSSTRLTRSSGSSAAIKSPRSASWSSATTARRNGVSAAWIARAISSTNSWRISPSSSRIGRRSSTDARRDRATSISSAMPRLAGLTELLNSSELSLSTHYPIGNTKRNDKYAPAKTGSEAMPRWAALVVSMAWTAAARAAELSARGNARHLAHSSRRCRHHAAGGAEKVSADAAA